MRCDGSAHGVNLLRDVVKLEVFSSRLNQSSSSTHNSVNVPGCIYMTVTNSADMFPAPSPRTHVSRFHL